MTTAATQLPPARPFTPEECAVLVAVGIITESEQATVLAGKRRFTVDECLPCWRLASCTRTTGLS